MYFHENTISFFREQFLLTRFFKETLHICPTFFPDNFVCDKQSNFKRWYKRAPISALRQAKFYLPWQAAAPQCLMYYDSYKCNTISCTAAPRVLRQPQ